MRTMSWKAKLWTYTVCIFFTSASYTMCIPFLPVYLLELGTPEDEIELWSALVFSSCFLIAGVMAPVWGKISDTHGKKSMALRSSVLLALCYTLGGMVTAPIQLLGVRIMQGFANGYLPVIMSIVSEDSPKEKLGTSMSFIQSAQLVGTVSGPLLGGSLAHIFGYRASFLIAGCFLTLVVFITYLVPGTKKQAAAGTVAAGTVAAGTAAAGAGTAAATKVAGDATAAGAAGTAPAKTSIFADLKYCFTNPIVRELLIAGSIFSMVMLAIQPLLSLYVAQLIGGYEDVAFFAGLACSLPPLIGAFTSPMWGYLGQRRGYYRVIAITTLGAGVFLAIQSFAPSYLVLMIMSGLMGLFIVGFNPALCASLTLATPDDFKGRAFGALTMAGQLGCMVGPFLGAAVSSGLEMRYQFMVSGAVLIALSLYFGYRFYVLRQSKRRGALRALTEDSALGLEPDDKA